MAHELTTTDGLVLAGARAWHGLGIVVEEAPTPREALKMAALDWSVEQAPLSAIIDRAGGEGAERRPINTHVLNYRSDTYEALGVVGDGYEPIQNRDLAEFASALAEVDGAVRVESMGSIRGGKRVWCLIRGESIGLGRTGGDEVRPYLMLANGHDGTLAFTAQPTTIRVVCSNTLHMALGKRTAGTVRFRHEGNVADKLTQARAALNLFGQSRSAFADQARALVSRSMTRDDLQAFFTDVYQAAEEVTIPTNPRTKAEEKVRADAATTIAAWAQNFDHENRADLSGASAWTAMNAVTRWVDHQRNYRASAANKRDARIYGAMWGSGVDYKTTAFKHALALA